MPEEPMTDAMVTWTPRGVVRALRAAVRIGNGVHGPLKAALAAWAQTWRHRRDVALLQTLDDRMLRDIGLTRGDVQGAASTRFWRDPAPLLACRAGPRGGRGVVGPARAAPSIVPCLPNETTAVPKGAPARVIR
jgi:uncharacterized protein YjiS (DUF1127 family)